MNYFVSSEQSQQVATLASDTLIVKLEKIDGHHPTSKDVKIPDSKGMNHQELKEKRIQPKQAPLSNFEVKDLDLATVVEKEPPNPEASTGQVKSTDSTPPGKELSSQSEDLNSLPLEELEQRKTALQSQLHEISKKHPFPYSSSYKRILLNNDPPTSFSKNLVGIMRSIQFFT